MTQNAGIQISNRSVTLGIIVSALGFFVDLYDIMELAAIGEPSLKAIGVSGDTVKTDLNYLQSMQMFGMLLGGFLWGIIGDKYGRLKVLFGSSTQRVQSSGEQKRKVARKGTGRTLALLPASDPSYRPLKIVHG